MEEELKSIEQIKYGILLNYLKVVERSGVNGSLRPNATLMVILNGIRSNLLSKFILKMMALMIKKHFP